MMEKEGVGKAFPTLAQSSGQVMRESSGAQGIPKDCVTARVKGVECLNFFSQMQFRGELRLTVNSHGRIS
jgi:hypothetical protein